MDEKHKIHAFYILSILGTIIVLLVAVQWSEVPKLVDYIIFALSVTSLFLGLIAIIFAIYSSKSFSETSASLNRASSDITHAASNITQTASELSEKVQSLPALLEHVEKKVDQTHGVVSTIFDKINSPPATEPTSTPYTPAELPINYDNFFQLCSYSGLLTLYACRLAFNDKKQFAPSSLCENCKSVTGLYFYGFFAALVAVGVMRAKVSRTKDSLPLVTITDFNKTLAQKLDEAIKSRTSKLDKTLRDNFDHDIELIKDYFSKKEPLSAT